MYRTKCRRGLRAFGSTPTDLFRLNWKRRGYTPMLTIPAFFLYSARFSLLRPHVLSHPKNATALDLHEVEKGAGASNRIALVGRNASLGSPKFGVWKVQDITTSAQLNVWALGTRCPGESPLPTGYPLSSVIALLSRLRLPNTNYARLPSCL